MKQKAKFYIYRNLHTGGFSVKFRGLVCDHADSLIAENVSFKVNEGGRQRVIQEKKKNVHAYVVTDKYRHYNGKNSVDSLRVITYNPYQAAYFTCAGEKIEVAKKVLFKKGKCYLIK